MKTARQIIRHVRSGIVAALAAANLAACADVGEQSSVNVREASTKLVSLNPCVDAILVEVAMPHQVLAISHYSHRSGASSLPQDVAREFASTGGTVEEILALDPDLVLASAFLPPATGQALRDLGVPFRTFASPTSIEQSLSQVKYIGKLAGPSSFSATTAASIRHAIKRNAAPPGHRPISTVLWQPGEIVPGEDALISELLREAGFSSHSAELGLGQADYLPLEVMLANPPELLLIAGDNPGQRHPLLSRLKDTRVEPIDPSLLYCGGPTIIRAMERLAEIRETITAGEGV